MGETAPTKQVFEPVKAQSDQKVESDEKSKQPGRWVRILRKHKRLLTFVGALIVFATFLAREGVRENLKDAVASIENAENIFLIREDIRRVVNSHNYAEHPTASRRPYSTYDWPFWEISRREELTEVELKNMERLIEKLHKPELKSTIVGINQKIEAAYGLVKEAEDHVDSNHTLTDTEVGKILTHARDEASSIDNQVDNEMDAFAARLDYEANIARDKAEHLYTIVDWASYLLYTLGWLLALMGRLVGVETEPDE